jgi:hypothetical protein
MLTSDLALRLRFTVKPESFNREREAIDPQTAEPDWQAPPGRTDLRLLYASGVTLDVEPDANAA